MSVTGDGMFRYELLFLVLFGWVVANVLTCVFEFFVVANDAIIIIVLPDSALGVYFVGFDIV